MLKNQPYELNHPPPVMINHLSTNIKKVLVFTHYNIIFSFMNLQLFDYQFSCWRSFFLKYNNIMIKF